MSLKSSVECIKENKTVTASVYQPQNKPEWDNFVSNSKNGVFLFNRDYMDYHQDRFKDHSLLFTENGQVLAVLPACVKDGVLESHGGLTFGGVVAGFDMKTFQVLNVFGALIQHCREAGIKEVVYKKSPFIYHSVPADEDLYALFACDAKLFSRNASSCIFMPELRGFSDGRKSGIRKAKKNGLVVRESGDYEAFMNILADTLGERHGVKPVHSVEEIKLLAGRFPNNIKLFGSFQGERMMAGVVMYESKNVAHIQYVANSKEGWDIGAQDIIEDHLINTQYKNKRYFDFGISTENQGQLLNLGLILRKENFSASAVMYDVYHITI
jgi:hypothetical protein